MPLMDRPEQRCTTLTLMSVEPNDENLARLCQLQQLHLEKIEEISTQLVELAESAQRAHEEYVRQGASYEEALSAYQSSDRLHAKVAIWRAVVIALMLGLIALAIFTR